MFWGHSKRWLLTVVGLAIVGGLVSIALTREPVLLDPSSPEGVVQRYLQAISERHYDQAFIYLDPDYYQGCDSGDLARSAPAESFSASLQEGEKLADDGAWVSVTLRFGGSGPVGSSRTEWVDFQLLVADDTWWITEEAWPYFSWNCKEDL